MTNGFLEETQVLLMAILVVVTAIIVLILHMLLGKRWAANPLARRVLGHVVVLVIIGVPALLGHVDFYTWLATTVVTFVAGGLVWAIEITEQERRRQGYVEQLRQWAEVHTGEVKGDDVETGK